MSEVQLQLPLDLPGLQQRLDVLDPTLWHGCFNARESSMHQLGPYVGKMKSGMVRVLLLAYSEEGDTVLDPFCGSGTTPVCAEQLQRKWLACDLSPEYLEWASNRIELVEDWSIEKWIRYDFENQKRRNSIR